MNDPDQAAHLLGKLITYVGPKRDRAGAPTASGTARRSRRSSRCAASSSPSEGKELYGLPYGLEGDVEDPTRRRRSPARTIRNGILGRNAARGLRGRPRRRAQRDPLRRRQRPAQDGLPRRRRAPSASRRRSPRNAAPGRAHAARGDEEPASRARGRREPRTARSAALRRAAPRRRAAGASGRRGPPTCAPDRGRPRRRVAHATATTLPTRATRTREKVISPGDAPTLSPAWTFSTVDAGGRGRHHRHADRRRRLRLRRHQPRLGVRAQRRHRRSSCGRRRCPTAAASTARSDCAGRAGLRRRCRARRSPTGCPAGDPCVGPYVVAFDQATGALVWATPPIDDQPGSDVYGSPVFFDGVLMIGVSGGSAELGDEADRYAFQGSMNVPRRRRTGACCARPGRSTRRSSPTTTSRAPGIWSTPAIDREAKVAYAGTANPFRPQAEHEHANAVLKFDVDRASATLRRDHRLLQGQHRRVHPGASRSCPATTSRATRRRTTRRGSAPAATSTSTSARRRTCSPTPTGRKLVGAGQKSGVYHVVRRADDGAGVDPDRRAAGALGGIVGSTAYDGQSVFGPITVPGYLWSLDAGDGAHRWVAPGRRRRPLGRRRWRSPTASSTRST